MLGSLFWSIYIRQIRIMARIESYQWDAEVVTAGDFTVELIIPKEAWEKWKQN